MASGSPRSRIDQFFSSKKKKLESPSLKRKKDTKTIPEGSPSAKCTLDNYLRVSADDNHNAAKKNLAFDNNNEIITLQPCSQAKKVGSIVVEDVEKSSSSEASAGQTENLELKQFKTDFLSLYCSASDLHNVKSTLNPKVNDHKRCSSPLSLQGCDEISKKRQCVSNHLQPDGVNACFSENNGKGEAGLVVKTAHFGSKVSVQMATGSNASGKFDGSLRKCNREPKQTITVAECLTPGASIIKTNVRKTPISGRGSSIFSPGEDFWDEAIQIAEAVHGKNHAQSNNSRALRNGNRVGESKEILDQRESRVRKIGTGASLNRVGKLTKGPEKEASPLPVKHLDFSSEDKNMDENSLRVASRINVDFSSAENDSITSASLDDKIIKSGGVVHLDEASTPTNSVPLDDRLDLRNWLAPELCNMYVKKGIPKLYPWQVDCLLMDGVLQRRNLVYCASTSAGKSFVAEILMLRRIISTGKIAILVLPYVSICAEKAEHMEALLEPLGKHVRSYYGNQGGGTLPKDTSVAVCTIEKANSLINRMLEEGRLSEIGIIVIDELHMVGDQHRGYLLELLLTKLRYAAGEGVTESSSGESSGTSSGKADPAHGLQIVGMSATMPNVVAVADWLQAALYQTDFRPVPLEEYIKVGNTIYTKKMEIVRTIRKAADLGGKDPDHIVELCNEVVQEGHSVLIFCSSRKGCESTAKHVAKFIKRFSPGACNGSREFVDIASAIESLQRCPAGLDPVLGETLPAGVAYHHAGLTVEEREIVETCYRKGLVRVLTATSTLAAGVNLPARRVIFRQPKIGYDFIDGTRYRQMAGRAGRTGIDTKGESVLICKPQEVKRIMGLLNESCPPLHSCLSEDKNGMTHAILEVVAGGIVQTANDIHRYVRCTLLHSTRPFQDVVNSAQDSLRWLCHKRFLEWNVETKLYSTTPLGRAAFGSSLCPEESLIVLDDLSRAREGFVLASDLHVVFLVTPINVGVEPDWELYYERFMELSALDQSVGNRIGVFEPFLMRMAHGAPLHNSNRTRDNMKGIHGNFKNQVGGTTGKNISSDDQTLRVCKRFFVALILSRLVQEAPIVEVCEAFKVARGMVQSLQENAGRFASMVSVFCERLGWHDLEGLIAKFQNRVSFGVRAEIVELTTIPYVKGSRARALYKAGLRSSLAIAEASIMEIVKALFESTSWTTQEGLAQKRLQLGVAKKIKNGARRIVLDKAEEARVTAFSAFKSLGLDVPQFSRPILSIVDATYTQLGEGHENTHQAASQSEKGKMIEKSDTGLMTSVEVNSATPLNINSNAQKLVIDVGRSVTGNDEEHAINVNTIKEAVGPSVQLGKSGIVPLTIDGNSREELSTVNKSFPCEGGPINAINSPGGFDLFLDLWDSTKEFYFDIHYTKHSEVNCVAPFEIHGIAICWESSPVYYVNLPKDLLWSGNKGNVPRLENSWEVFKNRWNRICEILGKRNIRKFTWNLKVQIQVLKNSSVSIQRLDSLNLKENSLGLEVIDGSYLKLSPVYLRDVIDLCIVVWILWSDEERSSNPNLEKEAKKRLSSEALAAAGRSGRWKNQMRRVAHNGCCRRVAQVRALCSALWKLLASEQLIEVLVNIEIPLANLAVVLAHYNVNVLADMELSGIGVNMEGCIHARNVLGKKLRCLEKEAYKLAGMTFSMYTAADIANVLFGHLKLPVPEGQNKGKRHPSTDKHCLDLLRNEHPIVPVIKEHRTLAKLLNCTLGSICSLARLSISAQKYTLHGHWLQTSTSTGRLSMEEPNLQCVEHKIDFKMTKDKNGGDAEHHTVNARDFFVPTQENWLLLTADYSQIELRLMAHFSKDSSLVELLSKLNGDVFTMIAATWTGKPEDSISSDERDHTKGLVYGILYGMGSKTLAEQLGCSSDEAKEKIKSFKSSFPGVASWLSQAVSFCSQHGYVETLKGRKRFLSKIKLGNSKEKSKAQRQAVNSICQGSAADIIKIAMINIYSVVAEGVDQPDSCSSLLTKFHMLKGRCRILLQVHDELVLEVEPSVLNEAALLLQQSMERAAMLLVPLHVKLKVGKTWGSLEPFQYEPADFMLHSA
ncbi:hypothetical protein ACFE04_017893 [Oxalis oulophora]